MKTLSLICVLAFCALLVGCSTPEKRWYTQRATLTAFEKAVLDTHEIGAITDEEFANIDIGVRAAQRWLAAAKPFLPDGGDTFEAYLSSATAVMDELQPLLIPQGPVP